MTDFAQLQFGKLNYVELPNEGDEIAICDSFASVECSSLFNDLYSPVCGRVVSVNREVITRPVLVNYSPYNRGWIIRAKLFSLDDIDLLMSSDDYEEYILNNHLLT